MYNKETETLHIKVKTNAPEKVLGILKAIDFKNKDQIALLLWPKVKSRELSCFDAANLSGMSRDELEDFYMDADLSDFQITHEELVKEGENIESVLRKRSRNI